MPVVTPCDTCANPDSLPPGTKQCPACGVTLKFTTHRRGRRLERAFVGLTALAVLSLLARSWYLSSPTRAIIRTIERGDSSERELAILELSTSAVTSADVHRAVPVLIAAMNDTSIDVRMASAIALGSLFYDGRRRIPELADRDATILTYRADAENCLAKALADSAIPVRQVAATAFGSMVPIRSVLNPSPALIANLEDPSELVRAAAANALVRYGRGLEEVVPLLIRRMPTEGPRASEAFAGLLTTIHFLPSTLPIFIEGLKSDSEIVRTCSARAIGNMRDAGEQAIPSLIEGLKSDSELVRDSCAIAIGNMREAGVRAIPALIDLLHAELKPIRDHHRSNLSYEDPFTAAAHALVEVTPDAEPVAGVVEVLCEGLRSEVPARQDVAAWELGVLGRHAESAIPALLANFQRSPEDASNRGTTALALAAIASETDAEDRVILVLGDALKSAPPINATRFVIALRWLGPKSEQMIPDLQNRTIPPGVDQNKMVRKRAFLRAQGRSW